MPKPKIKWTKRGCIHIDDVKLEYNMKGNQRIGRGFDGSIESVFGHIDYIVFPDIKTIVFNGSFIEPNYRGRGKYKVLVKRLLKKWQGWEFQCLAINPKVVTTLTRRFGFKIVKHPLFHWGTAKGDKGEKGTRMKRGKYTRRGIN